MNLEISQFAWAVTLGASFAACATPARDQQRAPAVTPTTATAAPTTATATPTTATATPTTATAAPTASPPGSTDAAGPIGVGPVAFCGQQILLDATRVSCNHEVGAARVSDLRPLAGLTKPTRLHLGGTSVRDLTPLTRLTSLTDLGLTNTEVADVAPLANLTNLQGLVLSDLRPLAELGRLKYLGLTDAHVPTQQVEWLKTKLPTCDISTGQVGDK